MPRKLSKSEREAFLRGRHVCVLSTIGPDGKPVLTPIWYLYRNGQILMRTGSQAIKTLNISRDPRITICVQDERPPYKSVTISGTASIESQQPGLGPLIARHYLGALGGAVYMRIARSAIEESEEVTLVVTPERFVTQDFSPEMPLIGRVWLLMKRILPPWL
ncbi:MAG: PPOX class F420-dependent oxidoreductase [Chloroflexi bacterium]|nr:PPOX class F420-dependent oxidoreductase [Chloroflexota bacterium]